MNNTTAEFTIVDANGRVVCVVGCPESEVPAILLRMNGARYVAGGASLGDDTYLVGDSFVARPAAPSPYHAFNWTSKQWQDPRTSATEWPLVRIKRDGLLTDTDWVVTKAIELGTSVPDAWRIYRQALRNITLQPDPFNLVWPLMPL